MEDFDSLSEAMSRLKEHGFKEDFHFKDGKMFSSKGSAYDVNQLKIHNVFRFEGESNPDDMSILYTLEASDGTKGVLVNSFGLYSDDAMAEFMKRLEDEHKYHTDMDD